MFDCVAFFPVFAWRNAICSKNLHLGNFDAAAPDFVSSLRLSRHFFKVSFNFFSYFFKTSAKTNEIHFYTKQWTKSWWYRWNLQAISEVVHNLNSLQTNQNALSIIARKVFFTLFRNNICLLTNFLTYHSFQTLHSVYSRHYFSRVTDDMTDGWCPRDLVNLL